MSLEAIAVLTVFGVRAVLEDQRRYRFSVIRTTHVSRNLMQSLTKNDTRNTVMSMVSMMAEIQY